MIKRMLILEVHEIVSIAKEKRDLLFVYVCQFNHGRGDLKRNCNKVVASWQSWIVFFLKPTLGMLTIQLTL